MRARVEIRFGALIDLSPYADRADQDELPGKIMLDVCRTLAILADQNDFHPQLAGRRWKPTAEELAGGSPEGHA